MILARSDLSEKTRRKMNCSYSGGIPMHPSGPCMTLTLSKVGHFQSVADFATRDIRQLDLAYQ